MKRLTAIAALGLAATLGGCAHYYDYGYAGYAYDDGYDREYLYDDYGYGYGYPAWSVGVWSVHTPHYGSTIYHDDHHRDGKKNRHDGHHSDRRRRDHDRGKKDDRRSGHRSDFRGEREHKGRDPSRNVYTEGDWAPDRRHVKKPDDNDSGKRIFNQIHGLDERSKSANDRGGSRDWSNRSSSRDDDYGRQRRRD
ncbi:MAG: hypothetical protein KDG50_01095 [Chromatiales bacterium]|nr:hypothetical protein [Chromatiales bacterium]